MNTDQACLREAGQGPGVLCLHANASSSAQWRALMDRLAAHFHVLAADGYGAGKSPPWNRDRPAMLDHEADLLASALGRTGDPCELVGHSYTGAWGPIRDMFAESEEARLRGWKANRFSFNVKGGRCEACEGRGLIAVEMHFLATVYVK